MPKCKFKRKLSDSVIDALQRSSKDVVVWDEMLGGFGCVVRRSGRKVYFVYYRNAYGQQRRPMIGVHGTLNCKDARAIAREWLSEASRGGDPSHTKHQKRQAARLKDLLDRYVREHAELHKRASTVKEDIRLIENKIKPALGNEPVERITRSDIQRLHQDLRHAPYEANRVLALLSKALNLAEVWELRPDGTNPCRHVKRFPEKKRCRFYTTDELARIGAALDAAAQSLSEPMGCLHAICLLALTGCRRGDILCLRWRWVDLDRRCFDLPESKTGARLVPLGVAAIQFLNTLPRSGDLVITGHDGISPLSPHILEHSWQRIRKAADVPDGRLHDFRHTVGTYGARNGHNAFVIRDLLGHKSMAMTSRYVERDGLPVLSAAESVCETIATALAINSKLQDAATPSEPIENDPPG